MESEMKEDVKRSLYVHRTLSEQWSRYRHEIDLLLGRCGEQVLDNTDGSKVKDFFSEATQTEVANRIPFEGIEL